MGRPARCIILAVLALSGARWGAAQEPGARAPDEPAANAPSAGPPSSPRREPRSFHDWLLGPLSGKEDPDGPINTDRPSFTPANTVVPKGRLQIESGFSFTHDRTSTSSTGAYVYPELAVRVGIARRVEFRTYWLGETDMFSRPNRPGAPTQITRGASDMEVGFKTQLLFGDDEKRWRPTTALITSVIAPTGGNSPFGSQSVSPFVALLYGWSLTKHLTLAGGTGEVSSRRRILGGPNPHSDNFEQFFQSALLFYSPNERLTLYHEWYALMYTNADDDRPLHNMDSGVLYRPTPNTQLDLRAGFGVGDRPGDFITGAGFSVRF